VSGLAPSGPILEGSLALVIPAHNESANIARVISGCRQVLPALARDWQIILVDDGSSDGTATVAADSVGDPARLRVIRHDRKLGYGITVADGLRAAGSDYIGFMDGDGQFDPADLERLATLMQGADLVAGWRKHRADPRYRLVIAGVFNVLVRILYQIQFRDLDCGLKLMRHGVLEAAAPIMARSALLNTELYFKCRRSGLRVVQVPVPHHPRIAGVRSGARLIPILRAIRDLIWLRLRLARRWRAPSVAVAESS
jgi:glycosyltransferase involved in cell wall biosynthesis